MTANDPDNLDTPFMRRAIRLAMNGRGRVEPNPMVGCIIVRDGKIIGQGYHQQYGRPHAEPNALADCSQSPAGATAYVTLEPCCHLDKQTPPCVPKLIEAKIGRVVVGCADPNPLVNGKGMEQLRRAAVTVDGSALEAECRQLIAPFTGRLTHHRPYVTLKWAESADGKVAGPGGERIQISNDASMHLTHRLRAGSDGILAGIETVLRDDPLLTARAAGGGFAPARKLRRFVLDGRLRLPMDCRLVRSAAQIQTIVYCSPESAAAGGSKVAELAARGVVVKAAPVDAAGRIVLDFVLTEMGEMGLTHLLVEPGPTLAKSFLRENRADRLWVFRSLKMINDPTAPAAAAVPYPPTASGDLAGDRLTEYLNPAGAAFFANAPSADWVLNISSVPPNG